MPRIYKPLPPMGSRGRKTSAPPTARTRMELSVLDDDPVQELISGANMFYPAGTHRTPQCKDSQRTPGPGAYRTTSDFPGAETPARCVFRRSPAWPLTARHAGRVVDIGNPYSVMPPVVSMFHQHEGTEPARLLPSRVSVNTMPPVTPSGKILKGHGGDVPKGYGLPY